MVDESVGLAELLCCRFEGFRCKPYICPAGVATIGYGATFYTSGIKVTLSDTPIDEKLGRHILRTQLKYVFLPQVLKLCPNVDDAGRLAALLDFTFNLGAGRLQSSTLRRRVNQGQWGDVATELRKWVVGGGKPLKGLVLRREAEISLL